MSGQNMLKNLIINGPTRTFFHNTIVLFWYNIQFVIFVSYISQFKVHIETLL